MSPSLRHDLTILLDMNVFGGLQGFHLSFGVFDAKSGLAMENGRGCGGALHEAFDETVLVLNGTALFLCKLLGPGSTRLVFIVGDAGLAGLTCRAPRRAHWP